MDDLTSIAVFRAVVDSGSFAGAADRLGVARSVVSRRVSSLEAEMQIRLLHRTTRRIALTEAGQRFYARVSEALSAIEEARTEVASLRNEPSGKVVTSVPMSFGLMHVLPAMPAFRRRFPKVELELRFDDRQANLLKDGVDVAIRIADLAQSSLVARRLAKVRHVLVAAPSYVAAHGAPQHPSELADRECLVYTLRSSPRRWPFRRGDVREHVEVRGHFEANNSIALKEMLYAGAGIGHVPLYLVADDLRSGRLSRLLEDWQTQELDLCIVYPTRKHVARAVRAFIDFMEDRIGKPPYWERGVDAGT
jgi:DNA-binding transcriptional LysR family regulator